MPPKNNNNKISSGKTMELRKRGKRGLYVEESKAEEEKKDKKKRDKLEQWQIDGWQEVDPISTLMKFEVIPKGDCPPQITSIVKSRNPGDILYHMLKPGLEYLIRFNHETFEHDKQREGEMGIHNWDSVNDFAMQEILLFLSIQTIIQFHDRLRFRTLHHCFGNVECRNIILHYTGGRFMDRKRYQRLFNYLLRPTNIDTSLGQDSNERIYTQESLKPFRLFFGAVNDQILKMVTFQQVAAFDERLHPHKSKKAVLVRMKSNGKIGYWICEMAQYLHASGLPFMMGAVPLLSKPDDAEKITPALALKSYIANALKFQPHLSNTVIVFDSLYSTKDSLLWFYERNFKYITNLKIGGAEGGGWGEYSFAIKKLHGKLVGNGEMGVYPFSSDISPQRWETFKKRLKNSDHWLAVVRPCTHLIVELSRLHCDTKEKMMATNALTLVPRHYKQQQNNGSKSKMRPPMNSNQMECMQVRDEYGNNMAAADHFNHRMFEYGYKRGGLRKGSHWWCTVYDFILTATKINALHLAIEMAAMEGIVAGFEEDDDVLVSGSTTNTSQVSSDGSAAGDRSLKRFEHELSAASSDDGIRKLPHDVLDYDSDEDRVTGTPERKKSEKNYGDRKQMVAVSLIMARRLAELSGKNLFYKQLSNGEWIGRNMAKTDINAEASNNYNSITDVPTRQPSARKTNVRRASSSLLDTEDVVSDDEETNFRWNRSADRDDAYTVRTASVAKHRSSRRPSTPSPNNISTPISASNVSTPGSASCIRTRSRQIQEQLSSSSPDTSPPSSSAAALARMHVDHNEGDPIGGEDDENSDRSNNNIAECVDWMNVFTSQPVDITGGVVEENQNNVNSNQNNQNNINDNNNSSNKATDNENNFNINTSSKKRTRTPSPSPSADTPQSSSAHTRSVIKTTTTIRKKQTTTTKITEHTFADTFAHPSSKNNNYSSSSILNERFKPPRSGALLTSSPVDSSAPQHPIPTASPMKKKARSANRWSTKSPTASNDVSSRRNCTSVPPLPPPPLPPASHLSSHLRLTEEPNGCFANAAAQMFAALLGTKVKRNEYQQLLNAEYFRTLAYDRKMGGEHKSGQQADTFRVMQQAIDRLSFGKDFEINHSIVVTCALCENLREGHSKSKDLPAQPLLLHFEDPEDWEFDERLKHLFSSFDSISSWFCDDCVVNNRRNKNELESSITARLRKENNKKESHKCVILKDPAPKYVIICIPRFSGAGNRQTKNVQLSHPTQFIHLDSEYGRKTTYELVGVAFHNGNRISGGHWTVVRNNYDDASDKNQFFVFDDEKTPNRVPGNSVMDQINELEHVNDTNRGVLFAYKKIGSQFVH